MSSYQIWMRAKAAYALSALLWLCVLFGGASRVDVLTQILPQLAGAAAIAYALIIARNSDYVGYRAPIVFLALLALLMALQLVPMPPFMWELLPGHQVFKGAADIANARQPWRPMTIAPDLTWASLFGILPPAGIIALFPLLGDRERIRLPVLISLAAGCSAILGAFQLVDGSDSIFRFYAITNRDFAVGPFANRNHYAVLLAISLPAIALAEAVASRSRPRSSQLIKMAYRSLAMFVSLSIVIAGSRAGLILGLAGISLYIYWLYRISKRRSAAEDRPAMNRRHIGTWLARLQGARRFIGANSHLFAGAAILMLGVAAYFSARALSVTKLFHAGLEDDLRSHIVEPMVQLIERYLPWGAGFGTFVQAFWIDEPEHFLTRRYVNHAHNDWLEYLLEGGVPGTLLLIAVVFWVLRRSVATLRPSAGGAAPTIQSYGVFMCLCFAISSVPDYPLRTPLLASLLALACMFISPGATRSNS
jgi:O-antigen ligase